MERFKNSKFYKHPNKLMKEDIGINYAYALLNEFSTQEGYVYINPILLISTLATSSSRLNGRDMSKIKESFQYLLDNNYIKLNLITHKGIEYVDDYCFIANEDKVAVKSTDAVVIELLEQACEEGFTKVYHNDINKLHDFKWSEANKSFMVYLAIMRFSYNSDVITVSFNEIKKVSGIKSNNSIAKIVATLDEYNILNKTNSYSDGKEGCYRYVRHMNKHLLGTEEQLQRNKEEREERNNKRSVKAKEEKLEIPVNTSDNISLVFETWQGNCPEDSYLSVKGNLVEYYLNNSKLGVNSCIETIELLNNENVVNNPKSFINKMMRGSGKINVVFKDSQTSIFSEYLSSIINLKNVVTI